jgi:hypothetical protein
LSQLPTVYEKYRKFNYKFVTMQHLKKLLYIFYIPLLIIEWAVDLLKNIWSAIHKSIQELTLVIESKIDEPIIKKPPNKG